MIQVLFAISYLQESPASFIKLPLHLSIIMSSFCRRRATVAATYFCTSAPATTAVSFHSASDMAVFDFCKYATLCRVCRDICRSMPDAAHYLNANEALFVDSKIFTVVVYPLLWV